MTETTRAIQDQDAGRGLVTAREVADLLGVPTSWVYEQSRLGRIPTVTLGRYRRYRLEAIEAWIEELEAGEGAEHFGRNGRPPQRAGSPPRRGARVRSGR